MITLPGPIVIIEGSTGDGSASAIWYDQGMTFFLTASHVLWTQNVGPATNEILIINDCGYPIAASFYNQISDANDSESLSSSTGDWAVVAVKGNVTNNTWMGYVPNWPGGEATTSGFPSAVWATQDETFTLNPLLPIFSYPTNLGHGCSGGPVWYVSNNVAVIAAINSLIQSDGTGIACQLTGADIATIEDWIGQITKDALPIARLYAGVLGRWPDPAGWAAWSQLYFAAAQAIEGVSGVAPSGYQVLSANINLVQGFTNSPEFQAKSGGLNNADFVTMLYNNVLGRAPDPMSFAWVDCLNNGTPREVVVIGFTESPEGIGYMGAFGQGMRT